MVLVYAPLALGLFLTSANPSIKRYVTPSCALGQSGRWVWEGGEAPCLAAQCITVGNAGAAVRPSAGASLACAEVYCVVSVAVCLCPCGRGVMLGWRLLNREYEVGIPGVILVLSERCPVGSPWLLSRVALGAG